MFSLFSIELVKSWVQPTSGKPLSPQDQSVSRPICFIVLTTQQRNPGNLTAVSEKIWFYSRSMYPCQGQQSRLIYGSNVFCWSRSGEHF